MSDGFVKSPSAALLFILSHCDVLTSTSHSFGFARLASGAFYCAASFLTFYEIVMSVFLPPSFFFSTELTGKDSKRIPFTRATTENKVKGSDQ
jgi:hypothetical protein